MRFSKGFSLVEMAITMSIAASVATVGAQTQRQERMQDYAAIYGNEISSFNRGVSRYVADHAGSTVDIGVKPGKSVKHSGSEWLKSKSCGGSSDTSYIPCASIPNNESTHFNSEPSTTIALDGEGNLTAKTVWSPALNINGSPDSTVMGIAALIASGNYISQFDDNASAFQNPTVFCPDVDAFKEPMKSICNSNKNRIISSVSINSTIEPWLRRDHGNTMTHALEFNTDPSPNSDIENVDDGKKHGSWKGSGMRQIVNVARLYNMGSSGKDSTVIGRMRGDSIYTDSFVTGYNLLNGAVITDGNAGIYGDLYVKYDAFMDKALTVEDDIRSVNGDIISNRGDLISSKGDVIASSGNVVASRGDLVARKGNIIASEGGIYSRKGDVVAYDDIISERGDLLTQRGDVISRSGDLISESGYVRARRFVDVDNTSRYLDPSSTSVLEKTIIHGRAQFGDYLQLNRTASLNASCSPTGLIGRDSGGALLTCQSGKWKPAVDSTPKGLYAYFRSNSCPSGWIEANGKSGTADVRGRFIRALDRGKGIDSGRSVGSTQGDAIRNITASYQLRQGGQKSNGDYSHALSHQRGAFDRQDDAGDLALPLARNHDGVQVRRHLVTFDASRVVPTANENRPNNVALLVCVKN